MLSNSANRIAARTRIGEIAFEAAPGEPVLYAGLRGGFPLPYECATGTCGTCKARLVEGEIEPGWPEAPGRHYLKAERREFLMCQARAAGACAIEVPGPMKPGETPPKRAISGRAAVTRIETLAPDIFAVDLDFAEPLDFLAGQFVVLRAPGIEGYRAYSMVSFRPGETRTEFVIKRKPGGAFSEWVAAGAAAGAELDWFGPLGKAVFDPGEQRTMLAVAGGSGIASIMAILEHGARARHFETFDGAVFFGVRTRADVFYLDRLAAYAASFGERLAITVALSHDRPDAALAERWPALRFEAGFPHVIAARDLAGRFAGRVAYVAGPPVLVDAAIRMLITQARLPARDIRYDKFG